MTQHLTRIVLTGSESVGKTTLGAQLAARYGVACVPEFAREYAAARGAPLGLHDYEPIAAGSPLAALGPPTPLPLAPPPPLALPPLGPSLDPR